jgi:hypothetical protein
VTSLVFCRFFGMLAKIIIEKIRFFNENLILTTLVKTKRMDELRSTRNFIASNATTIKFQEYICMSLIG